MKIDEKYLPGSYIIRCKKDWNCDFCDSLIYQSELCFYKISQIKFIRISNLNKQYRPVINFRYHIDCAKNNLILSEKECQLFNTYNNKIHPNEQELQKQVTSFLYNQELKNKLFYVRNFTGLLQDINNKNKYPFGKRGFSDFTIFLNNKVLFIELKIINKNLNPYQIKFKNKVETFGYDYFIIRSLKELRDLLYTYNIQV